MPSDHGFLAVLAGALAELVRPLGDALSTPAGLVDLLRRLGWAADDVSDALDVFASLGAAILSLVEASERGDEPGAVIEAGASVFASLGALGAKAPDFSVAPFDQAAFWSSLPEDLLALLLADYVRTHAPLSAGLLAFSGTLRTDRTVADEATGRLAHDHVSLDWEALGDAVASPGSIPSRQFGWGGPLEHERLIGALADLFNGLGAVTVVRRPRRGLLDARFAPDHPDRGSVRALTLSLGGAEFDTLAATVKPTVLILPVPASGDRTDPADALMVWPMITGSAGLSIDVGEHAVVTLEGDLQAAPIRLLLAPDGVQPDSPDLSGRFAGRVELALGSPWRMVGGESGSGVLLGGASLGFELSLEGERPRTAVEAAIHDAQILVDLTAGDSFLGSVIPAQEFEIPLELSLEWDSESGFRVEGDVGLSLELDLHRTLFGVLTLSTVTIDVSASLAGAFVVEVGVGLGLEIGPFAATVDQIGVRGEVEGRSLSAPGNLGPVDVGFGFKAPTGVGLSLESGFATGGGYLSLNHEAGEYAGILDIEITPVGVGITAIGLIATKAPEVPSGWSMYLSLTATFQGLQLGFGFTLNGVGGLVGIHRGVDIDALGQGIRTGALDSILFPDDPIADAPRILADIQDIFPAQQGQYVFGPVAKIGWGTPTLFEVDLGVVVQLPDPLSISLLGSFAAVLPADDVPLLELRVDVAGTLDLTAGTLAVDASLRDSRVVGLTLSGDMAIRASFVDNPSFLMAFGGFNPHFDPPDSFPELNRLSVALDTGDNLRIGLSGYFAITSNTVQFGARADLWAKALGLTVEGYFSFDALLQFSPFWFIIDLGFGVDVRAGKVDLFGVHLALQLEGPNPWYALGTATVKVLGIKKDFEVEATIGKKQVEAPRETVQALDLLVDALKEADAWVEGATDKDASGVVLAEPDPADTSVRVHPAGTLEVRQRVVPLDRTLDHYGSTSLGGQDRFTIESPTLAGVPSTGTSITEYFAPAQFFRMGEDEKISAPSFEKMSAGLRIGDDGVTSGRARAFERDYEQIVRDPDVQGNAGETRLTEVAYADASALAASIKRGAVARTRKASGLQTSISKTTSFGLSPATFVLADSGTGRKRMDLTRKSVSWSEARETRRENPAERVHIRPDWEGAA